MWVLYYMKTLEYFIRGVRWIGDNLNVNISEKLWKTAIGNAVILTLGKGRKL